jgi:hypothetical protein
MEEAIKGDVAYIRAHKVDEAGNAVFRYTANNFSNAMARSAKITIVEVKPAPAFIAFMGLPWCSYADSVERLRR